MKANAIKRLTTETKLIYLAIRIADRVANEDEIKVSGARGTRERQEETPKYSAKE